MKQRIHTILIAIALTLTTSTVSQAMSKLVSLTVEPQWPTTTTPGNILLYKVTAVREGSGVLNVAVSIHGLPQGTTVQLDPPLRFTGSSPTVLTALMTVTCPALTPADNYPFTTTGKARREGITVTNAVHQQLFSLISNPLVLSLDQMSEGSFRLRGSGTSGQTYTIETTTSLTSPDWTPLGSSTADGNGRFTFFPVASPNDAARFFRAVQSGP